MNEWVSDEGRGGNGQAHQPRNLGVPSRKFSHQALKLPSLSGRGGSGWAPWGCRMGEGRGAPSRNSSLLMVA